MEISKRLSLHVTRVFIHVFQKLDFRIDLVEYSTVQEADNNFSFPHLLLEREKDFYIFGIRYGHSIVVTRVIQHNVMVTKPEGRVKP